MQVFFKQNFALLAVPKTGSTAYEAALEDDVDIVFKGTRKHMTAGFFDRHFAPFLAKTYGLTPERAAVIRDPLTHLQSWYRYRHREELAGSKRSTRGLSFERYVELVLDAPDTPCAKVGTQHRFLTKRGTPPLHHLFAYEAQPVFHSFLEQRFKRKITFPRLNSSPQLDTSLSAQTLAAFKAARQDDYALYKQVIAAGGHLQLEYD